MRLNYRRCVHDRIVQSVFCFVALVGLSGFSACVAQDADSASADKAAANKPSSQSDLGALRAGAKTFRAAFNKHDAKAIAALWAENGEYIDDTGRRIVGRDVIEKAYSQFFSDNPQITLSVAIDSVRLLSDDAAIEDGRAMVEPPPAGAPGYSKYTAFHVKVDGKWLMASVRDTHVETPSAYRNVADLDWLIGTWSAESQGATTESVCRWVANKSFVERKYTITEADGTKTSGVQIIGWNPQDGHVQSWNFSPDGGHAVGVWSPMEGGWTADMRGVTGDGAVTTSVNLLKRLDDNAYVWQSVERTANGIALPDTEEVVLKRQLDAR